MRTAEGIATNKIRGGRRNEMEGAWTISDPVRRTLYMLAHVPLGVACAAMPVVGSVHCFVALAAGVLIAAANVSPVPASIAAGYIVGAEMLWRASASGLAYEAGKYGVALVLLASLVRGGRLRPPVAALGYLLLLLASVPLAVAALPAESLRQSLAFNLSGPLSLVLCVWHFHRITLRPKDLTSVLTATAGPVLALSSYVLTNIAGMDAIVIHGDSNDQLAGGFGPNQVSAVFGWGVLAAGALLFMTSARPWFKLALSAVALAWLGQAAITFSRGGIYNAAIAALAGALILVRDPRARLRLGIGGALFLTVGLGVLLPRLDSVTDGKLSRRMLDTSLTGRDRIARGDLVLWLEHPVLGVGPGVTRYERRIARGLPAHTEFTRLLAEHGLFGAGSLALLVLISLRAVMKQRTVLGRAMAAALATWALAYMANAAMRLAAPSFALGLASAVILVGAPLARGSTRAAARIGDLILYRYRRRLARETAE